VSLQADHHRPPAAADDPKAVVGRLIDEVINAGRLDIIDEIYTPQMAPAARRWITPFRESFPDVHMEVVDLIAEGEKVVGRFRCSAQPRTVARQATHRPPLRARRRGLHLPHPPRPHRRSVGSRRHPLTRKAARRHRVAARGPNPPVLLSDDKREWPGWGA
jgi:hypothetical protein